MEEDQLALLRNLRFKYFMIYVVSKTLEPILGRKIDLETVSFSPEVAQSGATGLIGLVALCLPVVENVLSFVATKISASQFSGATKDDNLSDEVTKHVSALLYASKASGQHSDFVRAVSDS